MKLRNYVELLIVILIVAIIGYLKFSKVNIIKYELKESKTTIKVPDNIYLKQECCMYAVTFKTFKSVKNTEESLNSLINSYEKIKIGDKTYYYDSESDISIDDYGVKVGFPFNEFYISFNKGKIEERSEN